MVKPFSWEFADHRIMCVFFRVVDGIQEERMGICSSAKDLSIFFVPRIILGVIMSFLSISAMHVVPLPGI